MVRSKTKKPDELLSPSERASLESEKRELETTLSELETAGAGTQAEGINRDRLRAEIRRLDQAIGDRTPESVRGAEKDKLVKREKELEDIISQGMPTWFEMRRPSMNPGAVRKHMQWNERNAENIQEYVKIQRTLRPFEPKSIENLRKEK